MSFSKFMDSPAGESIRPILSDQARIRRMEAFSAAGRPALLAVAAEIESVAPSLSDTEKQHVGRWVHRVLGPRGWRPVEKKRLPGGGLFRTAAVYRRISPSAAADQPPRDPPPGSGNLSPKGRLAAARERVRRLPVKPQGVNAFLRSKRTAAKTEL